MFTKSISATTMQSYNQRKRKGRANECFQQYQCPPEVLRIVSRSGFLEVKELGRFLFFTSPSFIANLFTDDDIWTLLLQSRFAFDTNSLNLLPMTAKETFLAYSKQVKRRPSVELRELRYAPADYEIIVNMFGTREGIADEAFDDAFFSTIVRGEDVPLFFKNGHITLNDKGSFGCHPDNVIQTTIHVHRLTDGKSICIGHALSEYFADRSIHFDSFGSDLEMEDPVYSKALMDKSEFECRHGCHGEGLSIDFGLEIDSEVLHIPVPMSFPIPTMESGEMAFGVIMCVAEKFTIASLNISAYSDGEMFPKEPKNVTFAHFLEGMRGWNY